MIGVKVTTQSNVKPVLAKVQRAEIGNLGHAGAAVRLVARRSIRRRRQKSAPGTPPHTRRGQLKRAIQYAVEKENDLVVVGTSAEVVGRAGSAHERGGRYRRQKYDRRPFMGPALENITPRLPKLWANSVK